MQLCLTWTEANDGVEANASRLQCLDGIGLEFAVGAIVYVVEVYAWRTARSAQFVKKHILRRRLASRLR